MSADYWSDVEDTFAAALEIEPRDRGRFLDDRCNERPDLRAEVDSLLIAHGRASGFLDVVSPDETAGTIVGSFRLLEKIGQGGMGTVYRAERADDQFTQVVAVKLIDAPLRNPEVLRRFRAERQVLATLNHANIVTLLDGGVTDEGQPYLVMEYVDGETITAYCAHHRLSLDDRLRLFREVCTGVQEAHQHGVVHRDLKPANILITSTGIPKILDFGVAKLVDAPDDQVDRTVTGVAPPMTPNYASPEQVRGLPATTASDIYSLGVLLYGLLAGARPYDTGGKAVDEILEMVVDREPSRPSAGMPLAESQLPYDRRSLRGDLDAIVLKAMSKEPARRYASARELAEDLTRHLTGRPVLAREPSFGYVVATLARRHRAAFASAAVSVLALLTALGVSAWETRIAIRERNRATERFDEVRQLANDLIFKIHDGVQPLPGSTPVRQAIVAEALMYLERLSRDPAGDAALRLELARGYRRIGNIQGNPGEANLGDREGALASFRKALTLLHPMLTAPVVSREAALEAGNAQIDLSTTANVAGARDEAMAAAREAGTLADLLLRRNAADEDGQRLLGRSLFRRAVAGEEGSLPDLHRAGEVFDALLAKKPDDLARQRDAAMVEKYIGAYYENRGDYAAALAHHLGARELDEKRVGADPSNRAAQLDLAIDFGNVAYAHWQTGDRTGAAAAYEQSLDMRRRLAESDPMDSFARSRLAYVHGRLALVYSELNRRADALRHAQEAVRISESQASLDLSHRELYAENLGVLGEIQAQAKERAAACRAFRDAANILSSLDARVSGLSGLAERIRIQTKSVEAGLAGCGPESPVAASTRK